MEVGDVQLDYLNMEFEFIHSRERFAFLKWGSSAFENMLVVSPGSDIVHQVKYLAYAHFEGHIFLIGLR